MRAATRTSALAAAMLAVLMTAPAAADTADGRLELSVDGRTWSGSLRAPLFDPALRWVPGDSRTAHFWVQNGSSDPGRLVVTIQGRRADVLMQTGDLAVTARGGGGIWTSVDTPGTHELLRVSPLAAGDRVRVAVDVAFKPSARNQSQAEVLDLALGVRLDQLIEPGSSGSPVLPNTGGLWWWWIPAGAGLVGIGAAVVARARKRGAVDD
jgi:hypothetical protein